MSWPSRDLSYLLVLLGNWCAGLVALWCWGHPGQTALQYFLSLPGLAVGAGSGIVLLVLPALVLLYPEKESRIRIVRRVLLWPIRGERKRSLLSLASMGALLVCLACSVLLSRSVRVRTCEAEATVCTASLSDQCDAELATIVPKSEQSFRSWQWADATALVGDDKYGMSVDLESLGTIIGRPSFTMRACLPKIKANVDVSCTSDGLLFEVENLSKRGIGIRSFRLDTLADVQLEKVRFRENAELLLPSLVLGEDPDPQRMTELPAGEVGYARLPLHVAKQSDQSAGYLHVGSACVVVGLRDERCGDRLVFSYWSPGQGLRARAKLSEQGRELVSKRWCFAV